MVLAGALVPARTVGTVGDPWSRVTWKFTFMLLRVMCFECVCGWGFRF